MEALKELNGIRSAPFLYESLSNKKEANSFKPASLYFVAVYFINYSLRLRSLH